MITRPTSLLDWNVCSIGFNVVLVSLSSATNPNTVTSWFLLFYSTLTVGTVWAAPLSCWQLPGPVEGEPFVPCTYDNFIMCCSSYVIMTTHHTHTHTHIHTVHTLFTHRAHTTALTPRGCFCLLVQTFVQWTATAILVRQPETLFHSEIHIHPHTHTLTHSHSLTL